MRSSQGSVLQASAVARELSKVRATRAGAYHLHLRHSEHFEPYVEGEPATRSLVGRRAPSWYVEARVPWRLHVITSVLSATVGSQRFRLQDTITY